MSKNNVCPVCGVGHLNRQFVAEKITYKNVTKTYEHVFSVCDVCLVDQVDAEEMRLNKRAVIRAKKQIDGLLTGEEVLNARHMMGLNQDEAAKLFGGGPKAFSKYENDDVMQSEAMDKLIRLVTEFPAALEILRNNAISGTKQPAKEQERKLIVSRTEGFTKMEYNRDAEVATAEFKRISFEVQTTH